jgi:two-component system, OmpR family, sensor histidine kinase VicK
VVISQNNSNNNNSSERTEVLHGKENVMNAILQFLSKAYRIDSCGDHRAPSIAIGVEEYKELLLDLKNRGTKLRFITDITKENIHYCKQVMKFAEEVRHIDGIKANFFVSETEYVATAARQEALPVPQVIYSNVKDIVVQQQYVFEAFWNRAIFADQKIREIEEGVDFGKTEIIQDSYAAKELFINMVRSAAGEILLIIPTVNAFYREERIGVIHLVREAEQRGVKVKVLIPSNDIIDKILQRSEKCEEKKGKQKKFEIRRIDLTSEIKSTILVIDRKASLVTELRDDSKENFVQAIGLTSYSTSKPTVLSYTSIFENFWKQVQLYEQLEIHDRVQKEFINVAAHELRSPIQPILGLSEVLKSKEGNIKEYSELIDVINRNAKRLRQLTEDILDVARIEGKLLNLRKSRFDLKELILNTIADHRSQIIREGKDNNNKVKIELAPKEGKEVYNEIFIDGDRERITQVISNLLNNSIKFTEEGTIIVDIKEHKNNKHSNREGEGEAAAAIVVVNIKDTGKGIDPAIREKLFEKFTTTSEKGMGLGLYLSRKIIESHGGEIWAANNTNGKGATFGFSLPVNSSL